MYNIIFFFIYRVSTDELLYICTVHALQDRILCYTRKQANILQNAPHFHPAIAGFLGKNSRIGSYEYKAHTNNTKTNIPKCKFLGTVQFAQYKQYKQYKTALFAKKYNLQKLTRKIRIPPTSFISRVGDRW